MIDNKLGAPNSFQKISTKYLCPICNQLASCHVSNYPSKNHFFKDLIVAWCDQCGSGWMPDAKKVMKEYYKKHYSSFTGKRRSRDAINLYSDKQFVSDKRYLRAKNQADLLKLHGAKFDSVYDFGFGLGFFLFVTNPLKRIGFDIDESTALFADYLEIDVLPPWEVPINSIDCILTSHSTEHIEIEDLDKHISSFFQILRPGGSLAIEVPHAALTWINKKGVHMPHTLFFSAQGLELLFKRHGFKVIYRGFASEGMKAPISSQQIYWPPNDDFFNNRNSSALFMIFEK